MELEELHLTIEDKLKKDYLPASILLSKMRLIDESSRKTSTYASNYAPFYYHLGKLIQPKKVLQFGFRLGLSASCFFKSCKNTEYFLGFQQEVLSYYSFRIGKHNLVDNYRNEYDFHYGDASDEDFVDKVNSHKWDCVIIDEETNYDNHINYLEVVWDRMNLDGIIVMDFVKFHKPAQEAYVSFCEHKGRKPLFCSVRFGIGIIQK